MSLKLLLYTSDWLPTVGGVQSVTASLATGLSRQAHSGDDVKVTLVTPRAANGMDDSRLPFRVVREPSLPELVREIWACDMVHSAGPALRPMILCWLLRKPIVVEHHGYQAICPNGLLLFGAERSACSGCFMAGEYEQCLRCNAEEFGWLGSARGLALTFVRRWLAKRVRANVAPSQHIGRRLSLPSTQVIYHGVAPSQKETGRSASNGLTRFAFVGRLVREKGVDVLLRAAHQLRDAEDFHFGIRIVGDGPERGRLEKMTGDLNLRSQVEFTGGVAADAVNDVLTAEEAIVMPSVCEDVAPMVALEQMMQGRLVIASAIGGLKELVGERGLTFTAGDATALAACMLQAMDRKRARELSETARDYARAHYTEQRMISEHLELYESVLRSKGA